MRPLAVEEAEIPADRCAGCRDAGATEGAVIPRVYGRMRVGGNIIWATDFREETTTSTQGGGGKGVGGGGGTRVTEFRYFCSFTVALCEGSEAGPEGINRSGGAIGGGGGPVGRGIGGIGRIWADGKPFEVPGAVIRLHRGTEDQLPDPHLEAMDGVGNVPAYRGTAYVVFEDLPLERFGNRLPQLSFEVFAPGEDPASAEQLVRGVNLIPSSGEFIYATEPIRREEAAGETVAENVNSTLGVPDLIASLDQLEAVAPNRRAVSLVVSWFGLDLRAGNCQIRPGVELAAKVTHPKSWSVNGVTRAAAHLVSRDAEGDPVYGGTPADFAVVQAIAELKARGFRVTFYPFLLMDTPAGNALPEAIRPHAFRHIAATSIAIEDPEHVEIIPSLLGHASLMMAEKHYNRAQGIEALRSLQEMIDAERQTLLQGYRGEALLAGRPRRGKAETVPASAGWRR